MSLRASITAATSAATRAISIISNAARKPSLGMDAPGRSNMAYPILLVIKAPSWKPIGGVRETPISIVENRMTLFDEPWWYNRKKRIEKLLNKAISFYRW